MSEEIKETLDDIKRHLDYVEATKQSSIRDNEMKTMYECIISLQQKVEQLENIRKEAIKYILKNKLYRFKYDDEELFEITTDKKAKDDLLNILNKGSEE